MRLAYSISAANTWEYKTITIPGDTSGTWLTDNSTGIRLRWNLGSGSTWLGAVGAWGGTFFNGATGSVQLISTSGATFYITGVQLEAGTVSTPFERRSYGQELALCQRYAIRFGNSSDVYSRFGLGECPSVTGSDISIPLPIEMRVAPTSLTTTGTPANYGLYSGGTLRTCITGPVLANSTNKLLLLAATTTGLAVGGVVQFIQNNNTVAYLLASAEL